MISKTTRWNFYARNIIFPLSFSFLFGCGSAPTQNSLQLMPESDYTEIVSKNTRRKQVYDGFMNTLDVHATFKTQRLSIGQLDQTARIYQWSPEQYASEKDKLLAELKTQSKFFLSFFVPERKHDDLHKKDSKWKIFLDFKGKRLEAQVQRTKSLLAEMQVYYPHHTRWATGYELTFPIATSDLESGNGRIVISGAPASTQLEF
jgi:hypothetical protein